ncbi:4-hydroxybenzoate octaprenyltransferase [Glaciecola petra]|uniref:4-hydroxybenzoate octaprenyltransferase n=1 Tax=Glaciecola petra TaxID=3075602 RepID=A0ABU2ZUX6_9ALTE|nr:4-hydroxybenzoate octaprenyltransferase [Aestuariibacter sp. P117]MDT0596447.1 4-hydroxybenzoate octaprenyltransferase [Aestuariibacter sp. P117]
MILLSPKHLKYYYLLMRADKPVGIYLLLWPTLWGLFLAANGMPPLDILFIFVAGVVVMRSAGCVINDYADRHVDGAVARTKQRPLATGVISTAEAKQLFALLILLAFILVLFLGVNTVLLSVVALLLASIYPFMKRYTHLPQVVLGAAFAWSIPMAFMAVLNDLPAWLWLVYLANVCWTVAYDTQYAMVDRRDDVKVGIKSTAILFGKYDLFMIVLLQLVTLALLACVFYINAFSLFAYAGLLACVGLFWYQLMLCIKREEQKCFQAFLHNNWVGMLITATILLGLFLP